VKVAEGREEEVENEEEVVQERRVIAWCGDIRYIFITAPRC
jgi:hypothetical protein